MKRPIVITLALAAFATIAGDSLPLGAQDSQRYLAERLQFARNGELTNPDVTAFNNLGQYTYRMFVPSPGIPSLRQTSLVTGEPDQAQQIPLGALPGNLMSVSADVNDAGTVVGTSFEENVQPNYGVRDAFVFPLGGSMQMLPRVAHGGQAFAINESNVVVGHSFADADGNDQVAARWTSDGAAWQVENLGTFGLPASTALAVNNQGDVLIASPSQTPGEFLILHADQSVTLLPDDEEFQPSRLNDRGQALSLAGGVVYDPAINGGQLVSSGLDWGRDLNNLGHVVGSKGGQAHLWDGQQLFNLNELVDDPKLTLTDAYFVNDRGQILATAGNFTEQAVLLTPLPEPESWMLFAGGAYLLIRSARRRARSRLGRTTAART